MKLEDKLYLLKFNWDEQSHIDIVSQDVCARCPDKPCTIALVGEAVSLVKEAVAKNIHGVGFPPLTELLAKIKDKVPVFV